MMAIQEAPLWADIIVIALVFAGAILALLGSIGLLRLPQFYQRVHAPTLSTTYGAFLLVLATIIYFTTRQQWGALQAIVISVGLFVSAPVSLMLLVRAALYRDRKQGLKYVPQEDKRQRR